MPPTLISAAWQLAVGPALAALLLSMMGIYGIVSYAAAQRTREVGIRVALGALKTDILKMMVSQGMAPVSVGRS